MTVTLIDRLLAFIKYVDDNNVAPAGPSRSIDAHLLCECSELRAALEIEKKQTKSRARLAAEQMAAEGFDPVEYL